MEFSYNLQKRNILHIVLMNEKSCIGYINLWKYLNDWEVFSVVAEHGNGYKMFEASMDFIYPQWFIPARNKTVTPAFIKTITRFIERNDIETEKITVNDDSYIEISEQYDNWFNRRYRLKEKINLNFNKVNYNFIKHTGNKLLSLKYPWGNDNTLD